LLQFERQSWDQGYRRLAGVDEAGRGPLAGPVVAAALAFDRAFLEAEQYGLLQDINDSKRLTARQRDESFAFLTAHPAVTYGLGIASVSEIDAVNILQATHRAMRRALEALRPAPDAVLIDGLPVPGLPYPSTAIVSGDARSLSVAAASIIAKVSRDRIMVELDRLYPPYGFARHKGYGTKTHVQALLANGPCPEHRRSFRPVREVERLRAWIAANPDETRLLPDTGDA
jgi:ribonuclease HII